MAKKVFMIAPFEAMTGNLSGDQELKYAENNNPAYEAPNGTQYARNYHTRYVGARRGKDGLVYFQVKQTSAAVLKPTTRRAMAIVGVTAAIRSALMKSHATDWDKINQAFNYLKAQGQLPEGQDTFNKWYSAQVKNMLVYKRTIWGFAQASISFTIHNPFHINSAEALVIKNSIWVKFANHFAFMPNMTLTQAYVTMDGDVKYGCADSESVLDTSTIKSYTNPNLVQSLADVTTVDGADPYVAYKGQRLYTPAGESMAPITEWVDGAKYTTANPNI